jgi:hypothetical protein
MKDADMMQPTAAGLSCILAERGAAHPLSNIERGGVTDRLMSKNLNLSPTSLERLSLRKLEGLIEHCKTQEERDIIASAWGRRRRYQETRTEKRLAKKQERRLKRMGF